MEGLTVNDPVDGHAIPGVAESWRSSDDGLTWTFELRPDARWSNGDSVTAGDFVYGLQRVLSPALGAEYASFVYCLRNAEEFNKGKLADFSQVGVRASDDRTLVLTLKSPTPFLPDLAALPPWFPVHRATIEKFGRIDARATPWTRPSNYVGNGAFVLTEWSPNQAT